MFCFEFKNVCFNNITITKNENNKTSLETNFNPIVINQSTFTIGPPLKSIGFENNWMLSTVKPSPNINPCSLDPNLNTAQNREQNVLFVRNNWYLGVGPIVAHYVIVSEGVNNINPRSCRLCFTCFHRTWTYCVYGRWVELQVTHFMVTSSNKQIVIRYTSVNKQCYIPRISITYL